jgi:hypothetical protein
MLPHVVSFSASEKKRVREEMTMMSSGCRRKITFYDRIIGGANLKVIKIFSLDMNK